MSLDSGPELLLVEEQLTEYIEKIKSGSNDESSVSIIFVTSQLKSPSSNIKLKAASLLNNLADSSREAKLALLSPEHGLLLTVVDILRDEATAYDLQCKLLSLLWDTTCTSDEENGKFFGSALASLMGVSTQLLKKDDAEITRLTIGFIRNIVNSTDLRPIVSSYSPFMTELSRLLEGLDALLEDDDASSANFDAIKRKLSYLSMVWELTWRDESDSKDGGGSGVSPEMVDITKKACLYLVELLKRKTSISLNDILDCLRSLCWIQGMRAYITETCTSILLDIASKSASEKTVLEKIGRMFINLSCGCSFLQKQPIIVYQEVVNLATDWFESADKEMSNYGLIIPWGAAACDGDVEERAV
jgi:hypothetical protein